MIRDNSDRRPEVVYFKLFLVFWLDWDSCLGGWASSPSACRNSFLSWCLLLACSFSPPRWWFPEKHASRRFVEAILLVPFRRPWSSIPWPVHRILRYLSAMIIYSDFWLGFGTAEGQRSRHEQRRQKKEKLDWLYCWFWFYIESYEILIILLRKFFQIIFIHIT